MLTPGREVREAVQLTLSRNCIFKLRELQLRDSDSLKLQLRMDSLKLQLRQLETAATYDGMCNRTALNVEVTMSQ